MRIVQILLTALAVLVAIIGGVFTAAVAAVTVLVVFITRRLFGKPRAIPARVRTAPVRRPATSAGDVIDVTATEISDSRHLR